VTLGRTEIVAGFEAIYLAAGGKVVRSPGRHWDYSRRDAEQIAIYGTVADTGVERAEFSAEKWDTLDESANGFKLRRKGGGERLMHRQLIAVKPQDSRGFILAEIRWLTVGIDRSLTLGALALAGLGEAVTARPASSGRGGPEPYVQAFLMSSLRGGTPSLVLPPGCFEAGREVELRVNEELRHIRLDVLLRHGADFDRVSFSPLA
jgi:hypothetical protein